MSNAVSYTINVSNSAPSAYSPNGSTSFYVAQNHVLNYTQSIISAYDSDDTNLTRNFVTNVQHGSLSLNTDGTFTYTPTAGYTGANTFSLNFTDPLGATSNTVSYTINVGNNAPSAYASTSSFSVAHDHVLDVAQPAIYAYTIATVMH